MARRSTMLTAVLVLVLALGMLAGFPPAPAIADTTPTGSGEPATVSADPLPTVQIDGVAWTQAVVGNTVYVGGDFETARPAGAAPGEQTTPRANLLAYDVRTGELIEDFRADTDAPVLAMTASPDGKRLYIGGQFTRVGEKNRFRIAAFDTATGALLGFAPNAGTTVRALAATNDTLYVGGDFQTLRGEPRPFAGAVAAEGGLLLDWRPAPNASVTAMTLNPSESLVVLGGRFTTLGGGDAYGMGAVDPVTGQQRPWAIESVVRNAGEKSSINSLVADGDAVFGTGYTFGAGGNFEGAFRADGETGAVEWLADCYGDHYSAWPQGDVLHTASHAHSCENAIDGFADTNPRVYYSSGAFTRDATGPASYNSLYASKFPTSYAGLPSPSLLHWYPVWSVGAVTGQDQAGWHVTGNSDYVVYGGEFVAVNGKPQQGLVRFTAADKAPNRVAPQRTDGLTPAAVSVRSGEVEVGWEATFDRDSRQIRYELYRNDIELTDQPIHVTTALSTPWRRPLVTFTDKGLPPGSTQTYRIFAFDSFNNAIASAETSVVVAGSGSTYGRAIIASEPLHWFRLDDADGVRLADSRGSATASSPAALTENGTTGISTAGAGATGDGGRAMKFDGTAQAYAVTETSQMGPQAFSVEAWVKTTTKRGGRIVGFSDTEIGFSRDGWTDRHLYLSDDGKVRFGVAPEGEKKVVTSPAAINDGDWHHVVGTLGPDGMALYVDGKQVASDSGVTEARIMQGHWRLGADTVKNWPTTPSAATVAGTIDDVAIYPHAMTAAEIAGHYAAASGVEAPPLPPRGDQNAAPTAVFGPPQVQEATITVDGSASSDPDGRVTSYLWDFGDGSPTVSGAKQTHTYAASGDYQVRLTVTDDTGGAGTATRIVTVVAPNQAPTAAFTATVTDRTASFDASGSTDPDGRITSYRWDFGDGTPAGTGPAPKHTYADYGTYTVRLTVTDDRGDTATTTQTVTIAANQAPTAAFTATIEDRTASFDASGSTDPDGRITSYRWDFGDGTPARHRPRPEAHLRRLRHLHRPPHRLRRPRRHGRHHPDRHRVGAAGGTGGPAADDAGPAHRHPHHGQDPGRRRAQRPGRRAEGRGPQRQGGRPQRHGHPARRLRLRHRLPVRHHPAEGLEPQLRRRPDHPQRRARRHRRRRGRLLQGQHHHPPRRRRQRLVPRRWVHADDAGPAHRHPHHGQDPGRRRAQRPGRRAEGRGPQRQGGRPQRHGHPARRLRLRHRLPVRHHPAEGLQPQLRRRPDHPQRRARRHRRRRGRLLQGQHHHPPRRRRQRMVPRRVVPRPGKRSEGLAYRREVVQNEQPSCDSGGQE